MSARLVVLGEANDAIVLEQGDRAALGRGFDGEEAHMVWVIYQKLAAKARLPVV